MVGHTVTALAWSAAALATTSSWWTVGRRCLPVRPNPKNPKALQDVSVGMRTTATPPAGAAHRDLHLALIASGLFGKTDADVVSGLVEQVTPVRFPPGQVVFVQGDAGNRLYLIASGKVKLANRHADGSEVVLDIVGASDVFGEVSPFDCGTREFTATAVTDVCAVMIERDQLLAWMAECAEISYQFMRLLARRGEVMTKCSVDLFFADRPSRIAKRLLLVSKRFGRRDGDVVLVRHDLTVEDISLFAGVSPATVDTTLCDFRERGWIRFEDGYVEILDGQSLAALPARR